jgi:GNAT superfamily N-acetyltransferase
VIRQALDDDATSIAALFRRAFGGLRLWTFQKNEGARRFYERHGFDVVEMTDGAGNEEHEPDVLYAWTP